MVETCNYEHDYELLLFSRRGLLLLRFFRRPHLAEIVSHARRNAIKRNMPNWFHSFIRFGFHNFSLVVDCSCRRAQAGQKCLCASVSVYRVLCTLCGFQWMKEHWKHRRRRSKPKILNGSKWIAAMHACINTDLNEHIWIIKNLMRDSPLSSSSQSSQSSQSSRHRVLNNFWLRLRKPCT